MRPTLRFSAISAVLLLAVLSSDGQSRRNTATEGGLTGTVIDIDSGRGRLQIESDDDRYARTTIETDAISTQYLGFGSMIAGKPEIFTGSSGFSNIRLGDRISCRGTVRADGVYHADAITLLGRQVAAGSVGVGSTRTPTSVATPTDDRTTGSTAAPAGTVEGTVRQINVEEGRLVIQTPQRRMMTVNTYRNTPVFFRGEQYRITNLEIGDRVRIEPDPRTAQADEITARRIEVTQSVQEARGGESGTVTSLHGRVIRTDLALDYAFVDAGRGEVRVDMSQAEDARGERIHARDLRVNDVVEISGSYGREGNIFLASTVRLGRGTGSIDVTVPRGPVYDDEEFVRFTLVTITGTVQANLEDGPTIEVLDKQLNRTVRVWVTEDFAVRTKGATYTNAESLRVGDTVVLKAYTDTRGNMVAQTIRLRNR